MSAANAQALNTDQVTLKLGDDEIFIATAWDITQSVLHVPSNFSVRLGRGSTQRSSTHGPTIRDLLAKYTPNTPFELRINGVLRMTGKTDGRRANGGGNRAAELTVFGRDSLAPMYDAHIAEEKSFNDATYSSLVREVLKFVGLDPSKLTTKGANADRQLRTGISVRELLPIQTVEEILKGSDGFTAGAVRQVLKAKIGERWMEFVRKQLDRAGLFLWTGGDGKFILSAPNPNQAPSYRILRQRGQTRNQVNVIDFDYLDDTRPRYSYGIVYGKGGSRKSGPKKSIGDSSDDIMINPRPTGYGYGIERAIVIRDRHCQNNAQAAYLAQRKLAEGRRHGFQLVYTVAGLTTESISGERAIWTPDTVVEVIDQELGIEGNFWIDTVEQRRFPQSSTTIRLMRSYDVVFGTPDFEGASGSTGVKTGFKDPQNVEQMLGRKK